jgi:acyl dehydratase
VPGDEPSDRTAVAACAVSIISGWATSVVATDLIAGWWKTDRLFCIAVAFLALVFATTTVSGVILLLQHRPLGRYLILAGAVVAVLTYGGVFIAGARVAWIVYALPVLPIASVVLALHPRTTRWLQA